MSFSPIIRVRKLLDKMKSERGDQKSPKLHNKRFLRNTNSIDSSSNTSSPNTRPKKSAKSLNSSIQSLALQPVDDRINEICGEDQFQNLPIEATLLIFSFLEKGDIEIIRFVSKLWNELSNDEGIWKLLCLNDWNIDYRHFISWKLTYYKIEDVFSDGVWEGMSRWIEPLGFDNEQRTTARLSFLKKKSDSGVNSVNSSVNSKAEIHRCASTTNPSKLTSLSNSNETNSTETNSNSSENNSQQSDKDNIPKESELKIIGSGITVNCAAPSPFKIEGERVASDSTGVSFQWNKQFERHTSVYLGKINFPEGAVNGTISYNDGITHWKGEFHYKKLNRVKKGQLNA